MRQSLRHLSQRELAMKIPNDPRLTSVRKWLRKFSVDEWPQLADVVKAICRWWVRGLRFPKVKSNATLAAPPPADASEPGVACRRCVRDSWISKRG